MPSFLRLPHLGLLLLGLATGLVLALPVDLSGAGCPPAGEGRNLCLVQESLAPALTTIALCLAGGWLLADLLFVRLPALRDGDRPRRPPRRGHGREAVEGDATLRAASWGVLPPPRRRRPTPPITVAAITGGPPALRAVAPVTRAAGRGRAGLRLVPGPAAAGLDREVLVACWEVATRRSAQLVDAVAADLGLTNERVRGAEARDPDPLLMAATWTRRSGDRRRAA